jgi:hypothetical protein
MNVSLDGEIGFIFQNKLAMPIQKMQLVILTKVWLIEKLLLTTSLDAAGPCSFSN